MKLNENEVGFWEESFHTALRDCFEVRHDPRGSLFCARLAAEVADAAVTERRARVEESTAR